MSKFLSFPLCLMMFEDLERRRVGKEALTFDKIAHLFVV